MSAALLKGLAELVPAGLLFCGSVILFLRKKMMCSFFQLLGSGCLVDALGARAQRRALS
jgi:hypothetical protein